jgi:hypothetical protein
MYTPLVVVPPMVLEEMFMFELPHEPRTIAQPPFTPQSVRSLPVAVMLEHWSKYKPEVLFLKMLFVTVSPFTLLKLNCPPTAPVFSKSRSDTEMFEPP